MTESQMSRLIVKAYEAAVEPALWPSFLTQYSDLVKAGVCGFQIHKFNEHRSDTLSFVRLPLELRKSYQEHYTKFKSLAREWPKTLCPGAHVAESRIMSARVISAV